MTVFHKPARLIAAPLAVTLMLSASPLALAQTSEDESDAGFIERILQDALGGDGREVRISGLEGLISSEIRIASVQVSDPEGQWLTIRDVTLDWRRLALLRGRLQVNALTIGEVVLPRSPAPAPAEAPSLEADAEPPAPFALPDLPVAVTVGELSVEKISLGAPLVGQDAELSVQGSARLENGEGEADLNILRLDGPDGIISLKAGFFNETRRLLVDLDAKEAAGGLIAGLAKFPGTPSVDLTLKGDDPISDFDAALRLATDGETRLEGDIRVTEIGRTQPETGNPAPINQIRADIGGDITPLFVPEYREFFGPDVGLVLDLVQNPETGIDISALDLKSYALNLSGAVQLAPNGLPRFVDVDGRIGAPDGLPVVLPLPGDVTELSSADLVIDFDASQSDQFDARIAALGLSQGDYGVDSARMTIEGNLQRADDQGFTIEAVLAQLDAAITGVRLGDPGLEQVLNEAINFDAAIDYQATENTVSIRDLVFSSGDLSLDGLVEIAGLDGDLQISTDARLVTGDLERLAPVTGQPLDGALSADLVADFAVRTGAFAIDLNGLASDLAIGQEPVDQLLHGETQIALNAKRDASGIELNRLFIDNAELQLDSTGTISSTGGSVDFDAKLREAGLFVPQLSGPLTLTGDATGANTDWNISVLALGPEDLRAEIKGDVSPSRQDVVFDAGFGNLGIFVPDLQGALSAAGTLKGDGELFAVDFDLTGPKGIHAAIDGDVSASAQDVNFDAGLSDLAVFVPQLSGPLSAIGTLDGDGETFSVDFDLDGPSDLIARIDGDVSATRQDINFDAGFGNIGIFVDGINGPITAVGKMNGDGETIVMDFDATGPAGLVATVDGAVKNPDGTMDLSAKGKIPLGLANGIIKPRAIQGDADFDITVKGTPGVDALSGAVTIAGARLTDPSTGIALEKIALDLGLANGQANIDLRSNLNSGGQILVQGPVTLSSPFPGQIDVDLNDLVLLDPKLYEINLGGGVSMSGNLAGGARIAGQIDIDRAEIRIPGTVGSSGTVLEMTHQNEPGSSTQTRRYANLIVEEPDPSAPPSVPGPAYPLNITINAPSQIFIRGRGLDAELGGSLTIGGTSAAPVPSGRFELIRGRMDILAQTLEFDEAIIALDGDFVPDLRMVATSDTSDVDARIVIEGRIDDPQFGFSSDPELPEDEVLAQLFFGKPVAELTPLEVAELLSAISTLSGRGGGLFGKIRSGLGVDQLNVGQDDEGNTAVTAGKYLTDEIYSDVTVNGDGTTRIDLNYDLTPSFTVKGGFDNDGETSIGIHFERDY